jgi:hypothetical protein
LTDDDIAPLCANLGRFKRLKTISLVSRDVTVCERGVGGAEGKVALRLNARLVVVGETVEGGV